MSNLWITCTLKAPGNYPPGDPGPGGGGQGSGGCTGPDCDGGEGCDPLLKYWYCDPTDPPTEKNCDWTTFTCGDGVVGPSCDDDCIPTEDVFVRGGKNYYYDKMAGGGEVACKQNETDCEGDPGGGEPDCYEIYCIASAKFCGKDVYDPCDDDAVGKCTGFRTLKEGDTGYQDCIKADICEQRGGVFRVAQFGDSCSECDDGGSPIGCACCYPDVDDGGGIDQGDPVGTGGGTPPAPGPGGPCDCGATSPPTCYACEPRPQCCFVPPDDSCKPFCNILTCEWECPPACIKHLDNCKEQCMDDCPQCLNPPEPCEGSPQKCVDPCDYTPFSCNAETECDLGGGGGGGTEGGGSNFYYDTRPEAVNNTYGYDFVDSIYERNMSNRNYPRSNAPYIPVSRSTLPSSVFRENVHSSIYAIYELNNTERLFSDLPYNDLSNDNIESSLRPELLFLLNQVKLATGETIKRKVVNTIRQLIISNRLDSLDGDELMNYLKRIRDVQDNYPDTRGSNLGHRGTYAAEAKAIRMAGEKSYPLRSDGYDGLTQQRMRLWKTLAPDLNKYLPITTSNGTLHKLFYSISDTLVLAGSGVLTMGPGDFQNITASNGKTTQIPVGGDFDRARVLKIEDLQKIMYYLDDEYSFTLNVKTDETLRVDERYGVTEARENYYVLTPNLSSVTDLERTSSFISNTKTTYTYQTEYSVVNNHIKYMAWPYMIFYIDSDDPIFNYITNGGEINITSKDFTMDLFEDNEDFFKFIKRIPSTVILIPSNMEDKVLEHFPSQQVAYGERELVIKINADPADNDIWEFPYLKVNHSYPAPGIDKNHKDVNDIYYSFDADELAAVDKYSSTKSELPRKKLGMGQLLSNLKNFRDNWDHTDGSMLWTQLYDSIDRGMMKNLYLECPSWEKTRSALSLNKISTNAAVNANYLRLKEVRSNDKKINDPDYNTYATNFIKEKASSDQVVEPGPLS